MEPKAAARILKEESRENPRVFRVSFLMTLAGLPLILAIGAAEHATDQRLGFSIFYLIPILIVTRSAGRRAGWLAALGAALTWMLVDADRDQGRFLVLPVLNGATREKICAPRLSHRHCQPTGFF
jgi:hypothetical protein